MLALAANLAEARDFEEALFWQTLGRLRMGAAQAISRDNDRGMVALAAAVATGMAMATWLKQNVQPAIETVHRAVAFDRASAFEPGYLRPPYARPESEWPALLEDNRRTLLTTTQEALQALTKAEECKPFDPSVIGSRRAEMWKMRPTAEQEVRQNFSTADHRIVLPDNVAYTIPMNYLTPFGDARTQKRDELTLQFFWPDFSGFRGRTGANTCGIPTASPSI